MKRFFSKGWVMGVLIVAGMTAVAIGGYFSNVFHLNRAAQAKERTGMSGADHPGRIQVDVVHPLHDGLARVCVRPGTVLAFEKAELYAKVSGYLKVLNVDIGSPIQKGQLLARISVPEYVEQAARDAAAVEQNKAKVKQMEARVAAAQAEAKASHAMIATAEADLQSRQAFRVYREKVLDRMKVLMTKSAVDEKLVDEKQDQYEASVAAELAAKSSVISTTLQAETADAKILQARADTEVARAEVAMAEAQFRKSKVLLDYCDILAPFDGVVTGRNFLKSDFIRQADSGGQLPILIVEMTGVLRIVTDVPDPYVPFVKARDPIAKTPGDKAYIEISALPGKKFEAEVSRTADSEDLLTRTMRTEIDLRNPKGEVKRGMYGMVTIELEPGSRYACRVPSSCATDKGPGKASVWIVRDGTAHLQSIQTGTDNGIFIEILSGLTTSDEVVTHSASPLQEGSPIQANPDKMTR